MSHFLFADKDYVEHQTLAERVKQAVRRETNKMLVVGAAALVVQSIVNLAIVFSV